MWTWLIGLLIQISGGLCGKSLTCDEIVGCLRKYWILKRAWCEGPASSFLLPRQSLRRLHHPEWKKEVLHLSFLTFPPKLSTPGDRLIRLVGWTGPVQAYYNDSTRLHTELMTKLCSVVLRFRQSVTRSELILGRVKSFRRTCCVHPCHTHLSDWPTIDRFIYLGIKETAILMRRNSSCRHAQCLCEVQKWVI